MQRAKALRMHDYDTSRERGHDEQWIATFKQIADDDEARRELIWINARLKGDQETVDLLERVDPNIATRLEPLAHAVWESAGWPDVTDPDVRRELYELMYDARLCHHAARALGSLPNPVECLCDAAKA